MKPCFVFGAAILAVAGCFSASVAAQAVPGPVAAGQSFAGAISPAAGDGMPDAPDSRRYADGTRAINEGRWADADAIFSTIAAKKGAHADGALYWKAYAENKLGETARALEVCGGLRRDFPSSGWIDECGALEIEIRANSGQPVQPDSAQDDELKLLALNQLLHQDEKKGLAELDEILNGNGSSERLKQGAAYILGQYHSDTTYPQIARLSYVEGDVRVSRGKWNEKTTGSLWEKAAADLPLETGFSLVTGDGGRAEVEFENASTLYLAGNSVLSFTNLTTTAGIPHTEVALLTGTVSLHIKPFVPGESFLLRTPTDTLITRYPENTRLRVTSFMDGIAIAALQGGVLRLPGLDEKPLTPGQTQYYHDGRPIDPAPASASADDTASMAAWDAWVANRVAARARAVSEVMKASGLTVPVPGMDALAGRGTFFDCSPYGTCWEPEPPSGAAADGRTASEPAAAGLPPAQVFAQAQDPGGTLPRNTSPNPRRFLDPVEYYFPCLPYGLRSRLLVDPTLDPRLRASLPWEWTVCHAGFWIHRHNHYVWVVGHRRHHLGAGRWVRSGRTVAYVPLHPHDVKDHLPVNRTAPVFVLGDKGRLQIARLDAAHPVDLMKEPPKEFRGGNFPALAKAEEPRMEAHELKPAGAREAGGKESGVKLAGAAGIKDAAGMKVAAARPAAIPIHFDPKSQSFTMPHQVVQGGKSVTVFAPVSNRSGDLQARAGGYGGGGFSGHSGASSSGGGSAHGSGGGGSNGSSGGGSHGGGSSSGGSMSVSSGSGSSSGSASSGGSHK